MNSDKFKREQIRLAIDSIESLALNSDIYIKEVIHTYTEGLHGTKTINLQVTFKDDMHGIDIDRGRPLGEDDFANKVTSEIERSKNGMRQNPLNRSTNILSNKQVANAKFDLSRQIKENLIKNGDKHAFTM